MLPDAPFVLVAARQRRTTVEINVVFDCNNISRLNSIYDVQQNTYKWEIKKKQNKDQKKAVKEKRKNEKAI